MANFRLSCRRHCRSRGQNAIAIAAMRSGLCLQDRRTEEVFDFTSVSSAPENQIIVPPSSPKWAYEAQSLWNAAEEAENRRNATIARECEVTLSSGISRELQRRTAIEFAHELVYMHEVALQLSIHETRVYLLFTSRRISDEGFNEKTRELDARPTGPQVITQWRALWTALQCRYSSAAANPATREYCKTEPSQHSPEAVLERLRQRVRFFEIECAVAG